MNILISHVYSSYNNGDAAILSAQISELKRVFKHPHLDILTVDTVATGYTFDGVSVCNSLMYGAVSPRNSRLRKLLFSGGMMVYTTLWAVTFRTIHRALPLPRSWRRPLQLLVEADMQVCVGGGYLRAKNDHVSTIMLLLFFHQIWLAKLLNKPVYLYAQSFGPYPKVLQQKIACQGLKKADLILVREIKSKVLLSQMGLAGEGVIQVPDSAFLFQPKLSFDAKQILGPQGPVDKLVGITVRSWLRGPAQARYEKAVAGFIDRICQQPHMRVVVIAQVTSERQNDDDRVVGERIQRLLGQRDTVLFLDQRFSHYEIKSIFARLDYLVGTRFHSVIFALTAHVPALAIEYEHKTSGIMQDLGLEKWVIGIEDVTTDKLTVLFSRLEHQRAAYLRQLHKDLPIYMAQASKSAQLIRRSYEQSKRVAGNASTAPGT